MAIVNPQGTLSQLPQDNPIIAQATGSPQPVIGTTAVQPAGQVGAAALAGTPQQPLPPPVSGSATLGQQLAAKGSPYLAALTSHLDTVAKANPEALARPGGWARTLVGAGAAALNGVAAGIGDVAAVGEVPKGGGALEGIARTMAAINQRQTAQRQQQQAEEHQKFDEQERKRMDDVTIAHTQMQTLTAQQALRIAGNEEKRKALETDKGTIADATQGQIPIVADGLNDADLHKWMQANPNKIKDVLPVVEHLEPEFDTQGNEFERPIYRLYDRNGTVKVGPSAAKTLDAYMPQQDDRSWLGMDMPFLNYMAVKQQAKLSEAQELNRQKLINEVAKNKGEADKYDEDVREKKQHDQFGRDIAPTMNHYGQDPLTALDAMKKVNTPEAAEMARKIQTYYGPTLIKDWEREAETQRHNKEEEQIKMAEAKAKQGGFLGNPNAQTPEEFLSSLDPQAQSVVRLIGTGRAPLNNPSYLLARKPEIMEAVSKAYPEFDVSKVKGYQDTYIDFTKGKTAIALNSGGTALGHLQELRALNTNASHIPGTPAYNAYENKVDTVASELAKFYGDATIPAIAAIKKTLSATLPGNREAAILTQAQSMADKLDSFETQWTNAAPSKAYQAPMPGISLRAKQARASLDPNYAKQHPELGVSTQSGPATVKSSPPPEAKYTVMGPDNKLHYTNADGTKDLGVVPQ